MSALPKAHILVVDDDDRLRKLLERYLKEQGYAVSAAADTSQARELLALLKPDLMVLDVMMPGQTGLEFAYELEAKGTRSTPPILMLTAMDAADDRIAGLESGVEDYLTKPFEPRELLLRLGNILKRTQSKEEAPMGLTFGDFQFDRMAQKLLHKTQGDISLTTAEREILTALAESSNQPLSREILAKKLDGGENLRHVDVQMGRLRKKLGDASHIQTVRGKGYKLVVGA